MAKAFLKFASPSLTDKLIITWAEFATPLAEIDREVYNAPHPERSLTVENLNPVMHRFTLWQSSDGATLDVALLTMDIDCSMNETEITVCEYVVGRGNSGVAPNWQDPVHGASALPNDQRLAAVSTFHVEQRGVGRLREDEYTRSITTTHASFTLTGGATFTDGDTFWVVSQKIVAVTGNQVISTDYTDIVTIGADTPYSPTHNRKLLVVTSNSLITTYSISALAGIANGKLKITTHGVGSGFRYLKIALSGADTINMYGLARNIIYLGVGEQIEILFKSGAAYVIDYDGCYPLLGQVTWGRKAEKNRLSLDGTTYNIADCPRLYYDYIDKLPVDQVLTSFTTWAATQVIDGITHSINKGFFAVEGTQFKVPDFRNVYIRALKLDGVDATRIADRSGGYQPDKVGAHKHKTLHGFTGVNGDGGNVALRGTYTTPGAGKVDYTYEVNTGSENTTKNIGLIPQIII